VRPEKRDQKHFLRNSNKFALIFGKQHSECTGKLFVDSGEVKMFNDFCGKFIQKTTSALLPNFIRIATFCRSIVEDTTENILVSFSGQCAIQVTRIMVHSVCTLNKSVSKSLRNFVKLQPCVIETSETFLALF